MKHDAKTIYKEELGKLSGALETFNRKVGDLLEIAYAEGYEAGYDKGLQNGEAYIKTWAELTDVRDEAEKDLISALRDPKWTEQEDLAKALAYNVFKDVRTHEQFRELLKECEIQAIKQDLICHAKH